MTLAIPQTKVAVLPRLRPDSGLQPAVDPDLIRTQFLLLHPVRGIVRVSFWSRLVDRRIQLQKLRRMKLRL